eukprot:SAG11_NODE_4432_length_1896_cov_2.442404_3_plen_266_part_00
MFVLCCTFFINLLWSHLVVAGQARNLSRAQISTAPAGLLAQSSECTLLSTMQRVSITAAVGVAGVVAGVLASRWWSPAKASTKELEPEPEPDSDSEPEPEKGDATAAMPPQLPHDKGVQQSMGSSNESDASSRSELPGQVGGGWAGDRVLELDRKIALALDDSIDISAGPPTAHVSDEGGDSDTATGECSAPAAQCGHNVAAAAEPDQVAQPVDASTTATRQRGRGRGRGGGTAPASLEAVSLQTVRVFDRPRSPCVASALWRLG